MEWQAAFLLCWQLDPQAQEERCLGNPICLKESTTLVILGSLTKEQRQGVRGTSQWEAECVAMTYFSHYGD